ncbi:stage II sporulation protein M [Actinobacteria bacterium YIM 96077]|uniref:Stage II sporulation protein M n=1 Tax=Phytoactinopolyspora halophila TaxID=1981511 RepID=A0A329R2W3_9ACTN|nr:stage II sporulation protein M [Phytoactinopolyspora halophila]AYY12054.1 stage II sporulation protein M [Actinobacteria bacterium YIM 96077]RAW18713.1 stage II sporulation protein M [Phytoactinopolyspora halophila]
MDVDAFIAAHQEEWNRLNSLVRRRGKLSGPEADELVKLYREVSTHLAIVRSSAPDPVLVGKLSSLVARARSVVSGTRDPGWNDVLWFLTVGFPATVYRNRYWWLGVAAAFVIAAVAVAWWVEATPAVQATIGAPEEIRQLVEHEFEDYYSAHPAGSFATQVWINNAWVAAACLALGIFLGIPVIYILGVNVMNIAVAAGLMASAGRLDVFFGLITPHGLLELTVVLVAAGAGLRLGWTVIDPGSSTRAEALAQAGRAAVGMAVGLAGVLLISGIIEGFVTPSPLPTWGRVGVGVLAEVAFLTYVWVFGRRAVAAGEVGDLEESLRGSTLPAAA